MKILNKLIPTDHAQSNSRLSSLSKSESVLESQDHLQSSNQSENNETLENDEDNNDLNFNAKSDKDLEEASTYRLNTEHNKSAKPKKSTHNKLLNIMTNNYLKVSNKHPARNSISVVVNTTFSTPATSTTNLNSIDFYKNRRNTIVNSYVVKEDSQKDDKKSSNDDKVFLEDNTDNEKTGINVNNKKNAENTSNHVTKNDQTTKQNTNNATKSIFRKKSISVLLLLC